MNPGGRPPRVKLGAMGRPTNSTASHREARHNFFVPADRGRSRVPPEAGGPPPAERPDQFRLGGAARPYERRSAGARRPNHVGCRCVAAGRNIPPAMTRPRLGVRVARGRLGLHHRASPPCLLIGRWVRRRMGRSHTRTRHSRLSERRGGEEQGDRTRPALRPNGHHDGRHGRCDLSALYREPDCIRWGGPERASLFLARALDSRMPDTATPHAPDGNSRPRHQAANPRLEPRRADTGTARWFGQVVRVAAADEPPLAPR
jgi:hypothetical protein